MLNFKTISKIFSDFLDGAPVALDRSHETKLMYLVKSNIETNQKIWDLEDSTRMTELGSESVATTKQEIDKNNQIRNDLIKEIDIEISNQIQIVPLDSMERFYSESPGMIIDRLAILYIKLSVIRSLLSVIEEEDLKEEYKNKKKIISEQINHIGIFLDSYLKKLECREVFFGIQQPVKIYNDKRVKEYIKLLKQNKEKIC